MINMELARFKKLDDATVIAIQGLQDDLDEALDKPQAYVDVPLDIVEYIEETEYELQRLWKFNETSNFHVYWNKVKWCLCPELDNREFVGTSKRIINGNCPYHGNGKAVGWNDERF